MSYYIDGKLKYYSEYNFNHKTFIIDIKGILKRVDKNSYRLQKFTMEFTDDFIFGMYKKLQRVFLYTKLPKFDPKYFNQIISILCQHKMIPSKKDIKKLEFTTGEDGLILTSTNTPYIGEHGYFSDYKIIPLKEYHYTLLQEKILQLKTFGVTVPYLILEIIEDDGCFTAFELLSMIL